MKQKYLSRLVWTFLGVDEFNAEVNALLDQGWGYVDGGCTGLLRKYVWAVLELELSSPSSSQSP